MLLGVLRDGIDLAVILDHRIGGDGECTGRRQDPRAPIAEPVAESLYRHRRAGDQEIRPLECGGAGVMHGQHQDHRGRLGELEHEFAAQVNPHGAHFPRAARSIGADDGRRTTAQRGRTRHQTERAPNFTSHLDARA